MRARAVVRGKTVYRMVSPDRGWGGPYGQDRKWAWWACVWCGKKVPGTNNAPFVRRHPFTGEWEEVCARNGHAPCARCGAWLPRLNDGCPREHNWTACPGKTEADRVVPQHSASKHRERTS
ncbi:hypothetical protein GCM10009785_00130 [Brooklawnia cerclae]|uniref:Uncharacterized protein n=1 Tax=Brooklawnia cerclae TaxID=349934 RepID=A0ABX0SJI9_9ACTN|nr:hypothetical protein [Brooklawnia cerclae]